MRYIIQSLKYLLYRYVLQKKFITATDTAFNLNFLVQTPDCMGRKIFKQGSLNADYARFLLSLPFKEDDVILDVGANMGWYAIVLQKNIRENVRVFAFEPEPTNFQLLKSNIITNAATGVKSFNMALAERAGHLTLYLYASKNSGRHSLLNINATHGKTVQVETIRMDDLLNKEHIDLSRVKLLKIDIEGYEPFALKGASGLLQHLPYMFLEFSPASIRKGGEDPAGFVRWLAQFDFNFYNINFGQATSRTLEYLTSLEQTENLFLVKKQFDTFLTRS